MSLHGVDLRGLIVLERLWGVEWTPRTGSMVEFIVPEGFVVAERRVSVGDPHGFLVYLVRKEGVPTSLVLDRLSRLLGGRAYPLGLKDARSIAYQYILVEAVEGPSSIIGEGFRAWLIGRRAKRPRLGIHLWNNFRLTLRVIMGDSKSTCESFRGDGYVLGFYGPQRFGVTRPVTHVYALFTLLPEPGSLLREYYDVSGMGGGNYRGSYESRAVEHARSLGDPIQAIWGRQPSIVREALQSYVWNRALSSILDKMGVPQHYEKASRALCPEKRVAFLARLPSRSLLSSRGEWASIVRRILRLESLPQWVLPGKAPYRPLAVEPCRLSCKLDRGGTLTLWLTLPRGIYATIAVRSYVFVNWFSIAP